MIWGPVSYTSSVRDVNPIAAEYMVEKSKVKDISSLIGQKRLIFTALVPPWSVVSTDLLATVVAVVAVAAIRISHCSRQVVPVFFGANSEPVRFNANQYRLSYGANSEPVRS